MAGTDREKALDAALAQIERQFGKGAVMRLGDGAREPVEIIPTGSTALDVALGIGGLPRGRVVEVYGPESSGKCLTADTYVWTALGLETIAELFDRCGQQTSPATHITDISDLDVRVVNERGELEKVAALTHNGRRPVRKLRLASGRAVSVTGNHPLRVISENGFVVWRRADRIAVGDTVVSALFGAVEAAQGEGLSEDEAILLGYVTARGQRLDGSPVQETVWDREALAEYAAVAGHLLGDGIPSAGAEGNPASVDQEALDAFLADRFGSESATALGERVPRCVRTAGHKFQRAFLSALFEGTGWVDPQAGIGLAVDSEQLAHEVQLMLYGLGVPCTAAQRHSEPDERGLWCLSVEPSAMPRFVDKVGFRSGHRQGQTADALAAAALTPWSPEIPRLSGMLRDLRDDCAHNEGFGLLTAEVDWDGDLVSKAALQRLVAWCEEHLSALPPTSRAIHDYLRVLAASDYAYETVAAIDEVGEQPTFDIAVPATHSFVANGILSHNTTIALHAVANAQKAGGTVAFVDAEHALDPEYAKRLGVDTDALIVSQPDTGEQALEITDMLIRSGALDLVVIDSVAALVPRAEIEGEMGDSHVGLQARLMSQALRKITGALNQSKTTAIFINQLREKVGVMFGSPETTTGGRALKFYASVRLDIRRIETLKDGTEAVGNRTRVKVVKNKMAPPFKQAEFDILYGMGISREGGLIDMGVEHGFIRKSGAWYTYEGDQLGQGKENARNFLRDNPDLADEIEKKIKEKLGIGPKPEGSVEPPAGAGRETAAKESVPAPSTAPATKAAAAKGGRSAVKATAPAKG